MMMFGFPMPYLYITYRFISFYIEIYSSISLMETIWFLPFTETLYIGTDIIVFHLTCILKKLK